jgi:hypothetical protein
MKKILHYLVLALGGLIVVGVIWVILKPDPRQSDEPIHPGMVDKEYLSQVELFLFLGSAKGGLGDENTRRQFGLSEKIYATASLKKLKEGDYTLTFRWIKPGGGVQETFRKKFHSPGGNYRCWSWLQLTGEELIPFSIGPFGTGRFLGEWKVRVYLNGLLLNSEEFTVR